MSIAALAGRQELWLALSELYLDRELTSIDYKDIKLRIASSNCSLEDAKEIDLYEVLPLLYPNLLSVAGIWTAFEELWLFEGCAKYYHRRNYRLHRWKCRMLNAMFCSRFRQESWNKIEQ